jgi:hypothetical protein
MLVDEEDPWPWQDPRRINQVVLAAARTDRSPRCCCDPQGAGQARKTRLLAG